MGEGKVALILGVLGPGQLAGVLAESREQARAEGERKEPLAEARPILQGKERPVRVISAPRFGANRRWEVGVFWVTLVELLEKAPASRRAG